MLLMFLKSYFPNLFIKGQAQSDILSGLTVALALIPEAIAFAFVAGVHPLVGLYAAFIIGIMTAIFVWPETPTMVKIVISFQYVTIWTAILPVRQFTMVRMIEMILP